MKIRVTIDTAGNIGVFTEDGSFTQGADKINAIYAALKAQGLALNVTTPPEQHRHDHDGQGQHSHSHSH